MRYDDRVATPDDIVDTNNIDHDHASMSKREADEWLYNQCDGQDVPEVAIE